MTPAHIPLGQHCMYINIKLKRKMKRVNCSQSPLRETKAEQCSTLENSERESKCRSTHGPSEKGPLLRCEPKMQQPPPPKYICPSSMRTPPDFLGKCSRNRATS